MAKDLPYFKFFCSEWNDGDITLEDLKIQGLFINVCSYYWSNECDISVDKLYKKFKHNSHDIDYLIDEGLIKLIDGFININFLDEQSAERKATSKKNSDAGKASAERRRLAKLELESNEKPTTVEIPLNENPTIKRREEEIREEKNKQSKIDFDILLELINKHTKRKFTVINKTIQAKYNARLKDGYTKDDIKNTIINSVTDEYHKETNFKYLTPEYYSRSATIDRFSQSVSTKGTNVVTSLKKGVYNR